jgi:DnaK suppressor protein
MHTMDRLLSDTRIRELETRLRERLRELVEETRQILLRSDQEPYIVLAGEVQDIGEQSVADLLVDLDLANVDRHIEEIRDVEAALLRIAGLTYGVCTDCGGDIVYERLNAYPTAKRCARCQGHHEKTYAAPAEPTL